MTQNFVRIDSNVMESFPEIHIVFAVIQGITVSRKNKRLNKQKTRIIEAVRKQIGETALGDVPRIGAFRRIYKQFGTDPSSKRPSADALIRRIMDPQKGLYQINTVVDAYNISSIEHQLPMAAYDFDKVNFPITLRFAEEGEQHLSIGDSEYQPVSKGSLVYADDKQILCREFNYRDAEATKVTNETTNLALFVDGCEAVSTDELRSIIKATAERIIEFNGGELTTIVTLP